MTSAPRTVACLLPGRRGRGHPRTAPAALATRRTPLPPGRLPRISRLMALAIRLDHLVHTGAIANYATLARLGHVSRARVSQIMNLLLLAPDIQEALLFLPPTQRGHDPLHLRQLQPLAALLDWRQQRRLWRKLQGHGGSQPPG
jgi:hypothetical protein